MKTMTLESGQQYGMSIFDMDENTVKTIDSDQNVSTKFKIDGIRYFLDEKDLARTRLQVQILILQVLTPYHAYVI